MAKIKNVEIDIKIGKRQYKLKNLILDTLLNSYAKKLVDEYDQMRTVIGSCMLKFSPLGHVSSNSLITCDEFNICISTINISSINSSNKIIKKYVFNSEDEYIYDYSKQYSQNIKISDYVGNKIYALGFSFAGSDSTLNVDAVLDVSNYDLYIYEGEEILITRIDEISTDAIFTSLHEKVKFPVHLLGKGISGILPSQQLWDVNHESSYIIYNNAHAKLTNFGFGNNPNIMEVEYNIDSNYEIDGNTFSIKNIWSPKGLYPSNDLYPSNEIFPDDHPYKYLILRFKLFQIVADDNSTYENPSYVNKFTGAEYLQAIPLDKRGSVNFNIKYERG